MRKYYFFIRSDCQESKKTDAKIQIGIFEVKNRKKSSLRGGPFEFQDNNLAYLFYGPESLSFRLIYLFLGTINISVIYYVK